MYFMVLAGPHGGESLRDHSIKTSVSGRPLLTRVKLGLAGLGASGRRHPITSHI